VSVAPPLPGNSSEPVVIPSDARDRDVPADMSSILGIALYREALSHHELQ